MDQSAFFPYPRTAHVAGSAVVDDDAAVDTKSCQALLAKADVVVIQEKVDGTNVGVHFEMDWVPVCQKRSGLILQGEHEQYVRFRDWVNENLEAIWNALGTRYVLFGEWLLACHGVPYDNLPCYFLAFDAYDKDKHEWLSTDRLTQLVKPHGIHVVPCLSTQWKGSLAELEALVKKSQFSSKETAEGVYLRFEKNGTVVERLKYRRKTFVAGREDFHKTMKTNSLSKTE